MDKLMTKCELIEDKSINGTLFRLYYKQFMMNCLNSNIININNLSVINSNIKDIEEVIVIHKGYKFLNILEKKAIKRMMRILNG